MTQNHQLSLLTTAVGVSLPGLAQVDMAEPWTPGSIATTIVLVGAIIAVVAWRLRRGGGSSED